MIDDRDTFTDLSKEIAQRAAQRRERELRGAWRAGYDYLNVYDPELTTAPLGNNGSLAERFAVQAPAFIPSDAPHRGASYCYDIGAVPDDMIKRAINGELGPAEVRGDAE
jgi:hypothetical protein